MKETLEVIKIGSDQLFRSEKVYIEKNSPDWFAWRRQGVTSSDVMILLNWLKHKTRQQIWEEKIGAIPMEPNTEDTYEPALEEDVEGIGSLGLLIDKGGKWLFPVCVESVEYPMMRAILDGLRCSGEPLEIKNPNWTTMKEVTVHKEDSLAYQFYYPQIQHQLLVTGADQGILVFHYYGMRQAFKVPRDDDLINTMRIEIQKFWQQVVSRNDT